MEKKIKTNINNKNILLLLVIALVILLTFSYIIYMAAKVGIEGGGSSNVVGGPTEIKNNISGNFKDCSLLSGSCLDAGCDKYFLCSDKKYKKCEIYDCGKDYGIGTIDMGGKMAISREVKFNEANVLKMIEKCQGTVDVIKNTCNGGSREMEVKVLTNGQCGISGFLAIGKKQGETGEEKVMSGKFSAAGENSYKVTFDVCEDISEIIAIGDGGVSIKKELK